MRDTVAHQLVQFLLTSVAKESATMQMSHNWRGHGPWTAWFAWFPLMINGRSVWLRTVQRRYEYRHNGSSVERRWMYQVPSARVRAA